MLYICKTEITLLVLCIFNIMFLLFTIDSNTNDFFSVINNLDSVEDDWASSNHVVNPFTNNIPGIF